ncbi:protein FAN-like isoform X1 [Metopolophium dirhodum]|uniref:protein FAN-like isoform X1 n=2 Tax=Metopolophium dirhodum TaxID=44670 RepID=UPI00298F6493|nr:protein FAN-like isoform X1 [Metopolophium dirhodum]
MENKERFSLLLLEPGEYYFEDYIASLAVTENDTWLSGRLKVCSLSLVFDPKDYHKPILKIPFTQCGSITKSSEKDSNILNIISKQYIEMLDHNVLEPYKFINELSLFRIDLKYARVENCLSLILQLHRASSLQTAEHRHMAAAIAFGRQTLITFDPTWLELGENIITEEVGQKITPLSINSGRIVLTSLHVYFQPFNNNEMTLYLKIKLSEIKRIIKRRFLLQQVGLEFEYEPNKQLYLTFKNTEIRDKLYDNLLNQSKVKMEKRERCIMTLKWQNGALSNYDYLLYLNSLADRTVNDLTQYPVFPWVVADYSSPTLDLTNSNTFRDLTKPIGALNPERLLKLQDRYSEMNVPKFLYGSHYSTPGFVLFYLVRKYPQYMLCLQNGRFDHPDRMFNSISDAWRNVLNNMSDFKELVPEFYDTDQCGDFLTNKYAIDFGTRHDGRKVGDVELPQWANSPVDFISKLRQALESDYVSNHLHHWIDLIFGYKQNGPEAIKANNVFYYLCYEGAVDLNNVRDWNQRHALEVQIMEFGQIPKQIFEKPHPPKTCLLIKDFQKFGILPNIEQYWNWKNLSVLKLFTTTIHRDTATSVKFSEDMQTVWSVGYDAMLKVHCISTQKQIRSVIVQGFPVKFNDIILPSNYTSTALIATMHGSLIVYDIDCCRITDDFRAHEDSISCLAWSKNGFLITGSLDCTARIWKAPQAPWTKIELITSLKAELEHENKVTSLALSVDNKLLATGTNVGEIFLWSFFDYSFIQQLPGHADSVNKMCFSRDCSKLLSCSDDCCFKVFDSDSGLELYTNTLQCPLKTLAWDGYHVFVGGENGILYLWDLEKFELINKVQTHSGGLLDMDVSNDGSMIATVGKDRLVYVWKTSFDI